MWSVESHSFISPCGVDAFTFTEDEIPKGMDATHIKALHITVFLNDQSVPKTLVDTGAALNICPLSTFHTLRLKESLLTPLEAKPSTTYSETGSTAAKTKAQGRERK